MNQETAKLIKETGMRVARLITRLENEVDAGRAQLERNRAKRLARENSPTITKKEGWIWE